MHKVRLISMFSFLKIQMKIAVTKIFWIDLKFKSIKNAISQRNKICLDQRFNIMHERNCIMNIIFIKDILDYGIESRFRNEQ